MKRTLYGIFQSVQRPGTFATGGEISPFLPDLQVDNVGRIGLPLCYAQANELKGKCEQAPYGRREETIVDTNVRNALQLDASKVKIGKRMKREVTALIPSLKTELGCDGFTISALPYKLVLYEEGGFFLPHRDTEKVPGMFATLVIQLPAEHTGGELVVQHNREEKVFDFAADSASKIFYAAFFADCRHELRPVTSGLRLCLIYNLVHSGTTPAPSPADHSQAVARVVQAVKSWNDDSDAPTKLVYVLQHEYTKAGLSFHGLKNKDRAVAEVLHLATKEADLDVHLAIFTKNESGSAEGGDWGYSKRRRWGYGYEEDPDDWSMCEVFDNSETLDTWVGLDDKRKNLGKMDVDAETEVLQDEDPFEDLEPDDVQVEECSGNEGATMERWYHLAALVLWPHSNSVAIKFQSLLHDGIRSAVNTLQANIRACKQQSTELQESHEMVCRLVKHLEKQPDSTYLYYSVDAMLDIVQSCDDLQLYIQYLAVVTKNEFGATIADNLLCGCKHFGWAALHDSLCTMLQYNVTKKLGDSVSFVSKLCETNEASTVIEDEQQLRTCTKLATVVHAASLVNPAHRVPVVPYFKMLFTVNQPPLLQTAVNIIKDQHMKDPSSLAAIVMELGIWLGAKAKECGPFVELLGSCIGALAAKVRQGVAEPTTWAMKVPFSPCCADCTSLATFLSNPSQQVGRFKMAKMRRMHLHRRLDGHQMDCSHVTERIGSPQTLVITKTRTAVKRQKEQHKRDIEMLTRLLALPGAVNHTVVVDLTS